MAGQRQRRVSGHVCRRHDEDTPVMVLDLNTILITLSGVFLIACMKGAFGGGLAIVGIPLVSISLGPLEAGALLAPLFIVMGCWWSRR